MIHPFVHRTLRGVFAALLMMGMAAKAEVSPPTEYDIKAVFLFNFAHFVVWPANQGGTKNQPLVIGVLGEDPFGARLDKAVRGEKIGGRAIRVNRVRRLEDAAQCDALYISASEKSRIIEILDYLKNRPILTVSDIPEFAEAGGMVELVVVGGKVRLHINVDESTAAGLSISAKLLRPAQIVSTRKTSQYLLGGAQELVATLNAPKLRHVTGATQASSWE